MLRNRLIYVAALAGSVVFFAFYDQWFSTFFLILVLLLPLLSLVCSLPAVLGFRVRLWAPKAVKLGEPAGLTIQASAPMPLPRYRLGLWLSHSFAGDEKLPRKASVSLPTNHCGALTVTAEKPRRYDYLGLFSFPVKGLPTLETLVRPRPVMPKAVPSLRQLQSPNLVPRPAGAFSEVHELRAYRPGDSLRAIHWKVSAKTDELVVREPMEPAKTVLILTADLRGTARELDSVLGQLLWLSTYLLEHELTHEIQVLTGNGILRQGVSTPEERDDAMDALLRSPPAESGSMQDAAISALWRHHVSPNS